MTEYGLKRHFDDGAARLKLAAVELGPRESRVLEKRHPVREVTTRRYHPGTHVVDLQVNGRIVAGDGFELVT